MQGTVFSVNVLRSPFGVRGANLVPPSDADVTMGKVSTVTDAKVADSYAQVLPLYTPLGRAKRQTYAVSGTRGIQQLVANTRSASLPIPSTLVAAQRINIRGNSMPSATPQLHVISKHEKGRLLVWNGLTGAVVAACLFPPSFNVDHCAVAASYVYTTVEGSAATSGSEEEACVYVWSRSTLRSVTVLRGHSGRLTALGVWPMETSTLIATASLDGTVRLWSHQHSPGASNSAVANEDPVQLLWVLATAELGSVHSLKFIAAETVVAAATRCALAFVRLPDAPAKRKGRGSVVSMGTADALAFQIVQSIVDPDGGTTFLHVCPYNRTSGGVVAVTTALGHSSLSPLASPSSLQLSAAAPVSESSTVYLLTGSTSGYIQEWTVDVENAASAEVSPKAAALSADPVYVNVKCRWYHKAHSATVDCVVTDEDVVVSTSLFDCARIYHRTSGATCAVTSTAAIPVLVPQLKELVWGTIDGALGVASYARFASGMENELQLLWTARPHATAIRGVCLSLTPDLRWDTLCTGAADGSMCVWRAMPELGRAAAGSAAAKKEGAAPLITHFLHVFALPPNTTEKGDSDGKRVAAVVAGLRASTAGKQGAILVVELTATGEVGQVAAVPLKDNIKVSCAHLCLSGNGTLSLWVGTRCGQLLHALHKPAQKVWTALTPVQWDAKPNGSVAAIADDAASSVVMVAVAEVPDSRRASQRLSLSALQLEPRATVETMVSQWEGDVALPCTVYAASHHERTFAMTWVSKIGSDEQASPRDIGGLLVCSSDGTMVRCFRTSVAIAAPSLGLWNTPEVLVMASSSGDVNTIQRNLDESPSFSATAVTAQSRNSDLLCLDIFESSKRVLMPSKVRTTQLTALLCDVGTERVRLAAVRQEEADVANEVALFDNTGRECGRVTHDGAVLLSNDASAASASKRPISYTPKLQGASLCRSSATAVATAAQTTNCTAIAAHAGDRIVFIGYDDGLLQMVDTTDVYVFCRRWATDATGVARRIVDVRYGGSGVAVVLLANNHLCSFAIPPRSLLDQPSL